jgi:hypothetical protein
MDTRNDPNANKFPEPRSWAAKWCGRGLARDESRPQAPKTNSKKFAEPRGWSAKWSGGGLFPGRKR